MAFTMLLRRLELDGVTHGFRSSFKDWCLSETSSSWAVSEAALAHNLGNSMEAAYARTRPIRPPPSIDGRLVSLHSLKIARRSPSLQPPVR